MMCEQNENPSSNTEYLGWRIGHIDFTNPYRPTPNTPTPSITMTSGTAYDSNNILEQAISLIKGELT